jgi:hypothetical protein
VNKITWWWTKRLIEVAVILAFAIPPFLRAGGHELPAWAREGLTGAAIAALQIGFPLVALYFLYRFARFVMWLVGD